MKIPKIFENSTFLMIFLSIPISPYFSFKGTVQNLPVASASYKGQAPDHIGNGCTMASTLST